MRRSSTLGSAPTLGDFQTPAACVSDPNSTQCADALGAVAAGAALSEFGPVGVVVGAYLGGHAREWAAGAWEGATGWIGLGGSAPCECQLGACNDGGDNTFNHDKFNALAGNCKSAKAQAAIEKGVLNAMAPLRAAQNDTTKPLYDRMEICMKLTAFAECAAKGWTDDAPCPGGRIRMPHEVNLPGGQVVTSLGACECIPGFVDNPAGADLPCVLAGSAAPADGSPIKTVAVVAGVGAVGWGLFRLAKMFKVF
jgi:hypothetical protein